MKQSDILKLGDGRHCVTPGLGLYLEVQKNGTSRSWLYMTRINGKRKYYGLGSASVIRLQTAIAMANEYRAKITLGQDPVPPKEKYVPPEVHLFKDVAIEAIKKRAETRQWKNVKHQAQWFNTVKTYAFPFIGKKDIADVTRDDIIKILKPIWRAKTETAIRLRGRLEIILNYAILREWRDSNNPAVWKSNLEFEFPPPASLRRCKHHEAPTVEELKRVVRNFMHGSIAYKAILFGILTASRTIEFVPARWGEINWATKVWSVPPERRKDKKKEPHRVPLSNQAIELLQSIRGSRIMNPNGFIFLSSYGWHITQDTPRIFLQRTLLRSVTMHGCRSTFRDRAAENGKNDVVAEKCLMHATGSTVVQAYQRSDLLKLRRVLLQEWADELFGVTVKR